MTETCLSCALERRLYAHGLCRKCYDRHSAAGTLGRYSAEVAASEREQIERAEAHVRAMGLGRARR